MEQESVENSSKCNGTKFLFTKSCKKNPLLLHTHLQPQSQPSSPCWSPSRLRHTSWLRRPVHDRVAHRLDLGLGGRAAPVSSLQGSCRDLGEGRVEFAVQLVPLVDDHACHGREHVGKARVGPCLIPDLRHAQRLRGLGVCAGQQAPPVVLSATVGQGGAKGGSHCGLNELQVLTVPSC